MTADNIAEYALCNVTDSEGMRLIVSDNNTPSASFTEVESVRAADTINPSASFIDEDRVSVASISLAKNPTGSKATDISLYELEIIPVIANGVVSVVP